MIERSMIKLILGLSLLLPFTAYSAQFSIVVLPDTQWYAELHPEIVEAQMDWIVANEGIENIIYVAHLGDIKDDGNCDNKTINVGTGAGRTEWQIVDQAFSDLDTNNIPYGVVPGNHDFDQFGGGCPNFTTQRPLGTFNTIFGPGRFGGATFYGGNRVMGSNEDNYTLFESDGVKFISINLAYKQAPAAGHPELDWADALLKANTDRVGILTSHYLMEENPGNNLSTYGQEVYDELSDNPNLFLMMAAHREGEAWLTETTGRAGMEPVQALLSDYQETPFPGDGDGGTPPNLPNNALINYSNINGPGARDSGLMRIMRFDTITGMVNITTFIPPVVPIKNRTQTVPANIHVSTYFPTDGTGMGLRSASNFGFSYLGSAATVTELVSCGVDNTGGDLIDIRGFYHPSYPGSTLNTVELYISSRDPGNFGIGLEARLNTYNGTVIASDTQTRTLSGNDLDNVSYLFDFGGVAVTSGNIVTFTLSQHSGPASDIFYAVGATGVFPIGGGGTGVCDMIQTTSATPPLDMLRRNGLWIRITGQP